MKQLQLLIVPLLVSASIAENHIDREIRIIDEKTAMIKQRISEGPTREDFTKLHRRIERLELMLNQIEKLPHDKKNVSEEIDKFKAYKKSYESYLYEIKMRDNKPMHPGRWFWISTNGWIQMIRYFLGVREIVYEDSERALELLAERRKALENTKASEDENGGKMAPTETASEDQDDT
eukprot:GHVN01098961.1.p1 GENE.GHVN01098961.1~~GHVN01098961.1.p1  ORF type:complete len:178 (+),score=30.08 GHVN01098961.1:33-566(+)